MVALLVDHPLGWIAALCGPLVVAVDWLWHRRRERHETAQMRDRRAMLRDLNRRERG